MKDSIQFVNARTVTPLEIGETFTSKSESAIGHEAIIVACKTDANGTLYVDFSNDDGANWDSTLTYSVSANLNEVHRILVTRPVFRVRFTNGSSPQSFFRLSTIGGSFSLLTSNLNSTIQQDADAIVARTISEEVAIAQGLFQNYSIVNKFGYNSSISTGTTPEDIWEGGGVYTGFATDAETVQVLSSSAADAAAGTGARTIRVTGLDANYNVQQETITLNGTTPVNGLLNFIRVHTATIITAGSSGVNAGAITVRQTTTTANVFLSIVIGRNQSNCSAYTIPAGYTAYMRSLHIACGKPANVVLDGNIWTRNFGGVFRSRRPFFVSDNYRLSDAIYGGLVFTEKSDIVLRINTCSANNTAVNGGYDLILVKNV